MQKLCRSATALLLVLTSLGTQASTEGNGLKSPSGDIVWPRWQGRLTVSQGVPLWRQASWDSRQSQGLRLESLGLLGDYYFGPAPTAAQLTGGFRATSGLIVGMTSPRVLSGYGQSGTGRVSLGSSTASNGFASPNETNHAPSTVPYVGLGYTSVSRRGGWGFSADVGLVAQSPGSVVQFGRVVNGTQTLDDLLRDMRLAPLLNVGVSYSF